MSKFLNEDRDRRYGKRVGDKIKINNFTATENAIGYVVSLETSDNNRLYAMVNGKVRDQVAEWCEIITKVEDLPISELAYIIKMANDSYRTTDNPIMMDWEWDFLYELLESKDPTNDALKRQDVFSDKRKRRLPVKLHSIKKAKTFEKLQEFFRLKGIPGDTVMILMPKYDSISCLVDEQNEQAFTGGGHEEFGQDITGHFKHVIDCKWDIEFPRPFDFTIGELIISRVKFNANGYKRKNGELYANPRNLASGLQSDDVPYVEILKDCNFIRFGTTKYFPTKQQQIDALNELNSVKVPYVMATVKQIDEDLLYEAYDRWFDEFEIDGIIIEVDNQELRNKLGFNKHSEEPEFAVAFKGNFEDVKGTICTGVTWQISKQNYLKPVVNIESIELNGVNVTNAFADNARFIVSYGIKEGSVLTVKRSGKVIPRIVSVDGIKCVTPKLYQKIHVESGSIADVHKKLGFKNPINITELLPDNGGWNNSNVELLAPEHENETVEHQKITAFFEILGCEGISDGIVSEFFKNGFKDLKSILSLAEGDMADWNGWGPSRASNIYNAIQDKLKNIPLEKIMHASSLFQGLGSKKLKLVKHLCNAPTVEDIKAVDGFSDITAKIYVETLPKFWDWVKDLPLTIKMDDDKVKTGLVPTGSKCKGMQFVFTGFRSAELEEKIILEGGAIGGSVSSKTSHLVMKVKGSGTTKEQKAIEKGITIFDETELRVFFGEKVETKLPGLNIND